MKNIFKILIISLTTYSLNAMNCSNYKDFQLYNGHYYSTSIDKLDFESAKQIAINNGGTLAIPNSAAENDFIKSLIGGGSLGWIGIHDPNKIQNFCYGGTCAYDDTRFKTVKNESLSYKNFHSLQPDNLIKQYDVVDGKAMVSPLGEHWVAMNGTNGKWLDIGNHADDYNNPVKYKAVFEFDNLNECTPPTDDGVQELTGRFCNTKVWDETVDVVTMGKTVDCLNDSYGNEYCPEALAKAGEYWTYDDGWSESHIGTTINYKPQVTTSYTATNTTTKTGVWWKKNVKLTTPVTNGCLFASSSISYPYLVGAGKKSYTDTSYYYNSIINDGGDSGSGITFTAECIITITTIKTCPFGGILNGSLCETISCPSGYNNTTGAEQLNGECKKVVSYTYYKYLCKDEENSFNENWITNNNGGTNSLSSTPPADNCKRKEFTCNSNLKTPAFVNNEWECSPFPCLGESNLENLDTEVGASDKHNDGWQEDGSCDREIYIFNGKSAQCRSWDMFFGLTGGGCCDKEKVAAGLIACKADEKILAEKRKAKKTHYIGNFCSKKLRLGFTKICIQKSDGYCTFNSTLGKIIQVQGRSQLNISWGSPKNPKCRGFTPDEFQKIDFSKIDLTEFVKDIQSTVNTNVVENLGTYVKDKVQNFYEN